MCIDMIMMIVTMTTSTMIALLQTMVMLGILFIFEINLTMIIRRALTIGVMYLLCGSNHEGENHYVRHHYFDYHHDHD